MKQIDVTALQPGVVTRIGQVPHALAAAHLLATTPLLGERAVFVVTQTVVARRLLVEVLQALTDLPVREWDGSLEVARTLGRAGIVVCDQEQTTEPTLPSPTSLERATQELVPGKQWSLARAQKWLASHGFERDTTANRPGSWALRGDILDVYGEQPVRIEFFGDTVERLSQLDIATGGRSAPLDRIELVPHAMNGRSSAVDHLPPGVVVVGVLTGPLDLPHATVQLEPFAQDGGLNAGYKEAKSYHRRYEEALADMAAAEQAVLFSDQPDRVREILERAAGEDTDAAQRVLDSVTVHPLHVGSAGVRTGTTLLLTDRSLGLEEEEQARQSSRVQEAMIQSLSPGDYVVHLHHGIARYAGTTVMHINELNREFFVLEYAEGDKIYVPVETADRVDKYMGAEHPQLHRLSGASWNEAVMRVRESTLELARELLDLYARRSVAHAPQMVEQPDEATLDKACAFELTSDQRQALQDVFVDIGQVRPMDRLLCGDVGFGKTEVALRAAYRAVLNGYQVAVLAPTTVLAQQHADTFMNRLRDLGVQVGALSRFQTPAEQATVLERLDAGAVDIVVGTHRLLSKDVRFKKLGLIVVDEEQRFGVRAKEGLAKLRRSSHVLTMTATPIPRTLHLSVAGVRDISTILTPPHERKAVVTTIQPMDTDRIQEAVAREMERNGQTYYVYNRVQTIERRRQELQRLLPKARIGVAHGQMPPKQLAAVMHAFDTGALDVLLATTIVENGLDIPTANTLIVESASMFGLAELYQLKGRVGRAERQGYAYFFFNEEAPDGDVRRRFIALQEADELGAGFELAMKDMEIRGVGNVLGKEQHGHTVQIGMNLYVRMLNQAVKELNGHDDAPMRDLPLDLPLEARIPEDLLPDAGDRVLLYQQLASIRELQVLRDKRSSYTSDTQFQRSGVLDPALAGLFDLLEIKLLASRSPLLSIDTTYPNKMNRLDTPRLTVVSERPFPKLDTVWQVVTDEKRPRTTVRSTVAELGNNWVERVKRLITVVTADARADDGTERSKEMTKRS